MKKYYVHKDVLNIPRIVPIIWLILPKIGVKLNVQQQRLGSINQQSLKVMMQIYIFSEYIAK